MNYIKTHTKSKDSEHQYLIKALFSQQLMSSNEEKMLTNQTSGHAKY